MAAGAPLRAATKKASGRSRPPSGFLLFRQHKQKQLRESIGRRLTKEECQAALAGATRAWKRDLSDADKRSWQSKARAHWARSQRNADAEVGSMGGGPLRGSSVECRVLPPRREVVSGPQGRRAHADISQGG